MSTVFISDLHLDPKRPEVIDQFTEFVASLAQKTTALYILGDFLEYWIGDDDSEHGLEKAFVAIKSLSEQNTRVYLMHGNRDFLLGQQFATRYHLEIIDDPTIIDLYGTKTLLMHGDTLCTGDVEYQAFRKMVRNQEWQAGFLSKPIAERRHIVSNLRETSRKAMDSKTADIMDVNQQTVENIMREYHVTQLIHGHTHRPNMHTFMLDKQNTTRIVLGDWYEQGSALRIDKDGIEVLKNI